MTADQALNREQAELWNGDEGDHWVAHQQRYDQMLVPFTAQILDAVRLAPGETVLDVGCGCGATTRAAAGVAGEALGLDLSAQMLDHARRLATAEGVANVRFEQGDGQAYPFEPARFDVALSRFGVMFFADPVAAFTNLAGSLRDGGRLVFTCWRALLENEWIMVPAGAALDHVPMPDLGEGDGGGPFSLAEAERIRQVLQAAGFGEVAVEPIDMPLRVGSDAADAADFMQGTSLGQQLLASASTEAATRAMAAVREVLRGYETAADGVVLGSAGWLVSARSSGSRTTRGS